MITTINELLFSKHYINDGAKTRFKRIREIQILTELDNIELANKRLKSALYNLSLKKLDNIINTNFVIYVIPKITFIENGKRIQTVLSSDAGNGNSFIFICNDGQVITTYLSRSNDLSFILNKVKEHNKIKPKGIYSLLDNHLYDKNIDDETIIDLDISDFDFFKTYTPFNTLSNNDLTKILTKKELSNISNDLETYNKNKPAETVMSGNFMVHNLGDIELTEKEFVVGTIGEEIYTYVNNEPKIKTIRRAYRDEKVSPAKMYLEFERTIKPLELKIGSNFIIKPKNENEETLRLKEQFGIKPGQDVYFSGKIVRLTFYKKEKTKTVEKIGIIIRPSQVLSL